MVGWKIGEGEALGLMHTGVGDDMICCCKNGRGEEGEGWGAAGGQASLEEKRGCWLLSKSERAAAGADEDSSRDCWLIRITLVVDS